MVSLNPLSWGRTKDDERIRFQRELTIAETSKPSASDEEREYITSMARQGIIAIDEMVQRLITGNPYFHPLIPLASHLNSIVKLTNKEAHIARLRLEQHLLILKLNMPQEVFDDNGYEFLDSFRYWFHMRINGTSEGWIGRIMTHQYKIIQTGYVEPEKKGFFRR